MVLATSLVISFFLSPFIVDNIGVEANGFVALANNFVTYAALLVTALNSMAARFISIAYVQRDYKKANLYYNSVFWGNLIIVVVLLLPAALLVAKLEYVVDIPSEIVLDVKLLFSFVFMNFFLMTGLPNWDCGTYVTNRLERKYIPNMLAAILKCGVLFCMMLLLTPRVWYVGLAASLVTIIGLIVAWYNTHTLTPELRIHLKKGEVQYSGEAIKELVGSGIWNSISSVGIMLLSGLDLVICNLALGATSMGILSLSKTLPNHMQQLSSSIQGAFAPELTINYAKGDKGAVLLDVNRAMKMTSILLTIPIAIIVVLGDCFFALWVPSQDAKLLQVLSVLAILGYMFTSGTQILYNVFPTVNKVRQNAIAVLISGAASTAVVLLLLRFTDYGIFAVAGVSTVANLVRNMTFTVPYAAKYLGFSWHKFFPQVGITVLSSVVMIVGGYLLKPCLPQGSWWSLILSAAVIGVLGLIMNLFLVLNKAERAYLAGKLWRRFRRHAK